MEKQIIIGLVGLVGVYAVYRMLAVPQRMQQREHDPYDTILHDEKYKVKGQWDR